MQDWSKKVRLAVASWMWLMMIHFFPRLIDYAEYQLKNKPILSETTSLPFSFKYAVRERLMDLTTSQQTF